MEMRRLLVGLAAVAVGFGEPGEAGGETQEAAVYKASEFLPNAGFYIANQKGNNLKNQLIAGHIGDRKSWILYGNHKNFILDRMTAERHHWNIGDVVERKLGGTVCRFQCIDQNYSDRMENHKPAALFLCMSVIPADTGSYYRYEEPGGYVFCPGPLVNFGDESDYKYSKIRKWLQSCEGKVPGALDIYTGVDLAYEGNTGVQRFGQLDADGLRGSYIGCQKMTDRLFCLSVDEALKYREYLWRFEGSENENPDSQSGPYSKGYWLRNPAGGKENYDLGQVYIVDLVNGNIRTQSVRPEDGNGDEETDVTVTTGVRPVFAMPQDF